MFRNSKALFHLELLFSKSFKSQNSFFCSAFAVWLRMQVLYIGCFGLDLYALYENNFAFMCACRSGIDMVILVCVLCRTF